MASVLAMNPCLFSSPFRVRVCSAPCTKFSSEMMGTRLEVSKLSMAVLPKLKLQPVVASRVCKFTGKRSNVKNLVSFSKKRVKSLQMVNLQYKKMWWAAGNRWVKVRLSTSAIRTIEKNGLDAVAKKAGINLRKEK